MELWKQRHSLSNVLIQSLQNKKKYLEFYSICVIKKYAQNKKTTQQFLLDAQFTAFLELAFIKKASKIISSWIIFSGVIIYVNF